ncbi:MAG: hypothetical protein AAFV53_35740 [Myxococcota bacterium]
MRSMLLALGLSLTPLGGEVSLQDGVIGGAATADLADLEVQVGDSRFVARLGRMAVGAFALQMADVEVDWLLQPRLSQGDDGLLLGGGVGVRYAGNAATWSLGPRFLGRAGWSLQGDRRVRTDLFAEGVIGADLGPQIAAGEIGLRLGVAWTWGIR